MSESDLYKIVSLYADDEMFPYLLSFEQSVFNLFDIKHPETPFLLTLSMQLEASFENEKLGYVANQELS